METVDLAIIGGGPAGLAAGLYGARARARTVVFERGLPGGQIVTTEWVENYPAFPEGISGADLGELMVKQAEHFGTEIRSFAEVESITPEGMDFRVLVDGGEVMARAVILATGAIPKKLFIPGEAEFTGRGVSWCATCDGALFRDKVVCVIGGGDAALQEALFLAKFASRVHVIHRRDELRATQCIQEYCFENDRIEMHFNRIPLEIVGQDSKVRAIRLASTTEEAEEMLPLDGVFIFIGVDPKNELVTDLVDLDQGGFVKTDQAGFTSVPGIFAAGDVTQGELKQVITAAAKGASAAFAALHYVDTKVCSL